MMVVMVVMVTVRGLEDWTVGWVEPLRVMRETMSVNKYFASPSSP